MNSKFKTFFYLHLLLMFYSISGIVSKLAANEPLFSWLFFAYYVASLLILGLYAIGWQQILKKLPLTTAFSNKAITIVWGIIWGVFFFSESIDLVEMFGAFLIIVGVVLFSHADFDNKETDGQNKQEIFYE